MEEVYEKYEMRWSAGGDVIEFSHLCLERKKGASLGRGSREGGGESKALDFLVGKGFSDANISHLALCLLLQWPGLVVCLYLPNKAP